MTSTTFIFLLFFRRELCIFVFSVFLFWNRCIPLYIFFCFGFTSLLRCTRGVIGAITLPRFSHVDVFRWEYIFCCSLCIVMGFRFFRGVSREFVFGNVCAIGPWGVDFRTGQFCLRLSIQSDRLLVQFRGSPIEFLVPRGSTCKAFRRANLCVTNHEVTTRIGLNTWGFRVSVVHEGGRETKEIFHRFRRNFSFSHGVPFVVNGAN